MAMGIQNSTAQRLAVPELTTTVLTRTLTGLAIRDPLGGRRPRVPAGRSPSAAMLLGALAGALMVLHVSIAAALALASGLSAGVALAAHLVSRGAPLWSRP